MEACDAEMKIVNWIFEKGDLDFPNEKTNYGVYKTQI